MASLTEDYFRNDTAARELIESIRWPDGPVCSHCGSVGHAYAVTGRDGLYRCAEPECRKDFTVTTGTVMERSKVPLHKWLIAFYLMNASKKGISAHQLHRTLGVTYQTAWFMCHRIREAMRDGGLTPLGGAGKVVEADETYFGPVEERTPSAQRRGRPYTKGGKSGPSGKRAVVSLVERGGRVRSRKITGADRPISLDIHDALKQEIDRASTLHTDGAKHYKVSPFYGQHESVDHNKQFVRDGKTDEKVHVNTAEGYFSIFKRGLVGTYQHMSEQHLPRYLAEFDFRMNNRIALGVNDDMRTDKALEGIVGKRLTYRRINEVPFP